MTMWMTRRRVLLVVKFGVVPKEEDKEFKVKIRNEEVDKLIKEYKKIKKQEKSNMSEIKKLGLVDKFGNPL